MTTQINLFLPEDIIINILLRLPVKSIGRCRCVSKQWRCLLSHPHFIKTHTDRTRNSKLHQQSLLLVGSDSYLYYATLDDAHQVFDEMSLRPTKLIFVDASLDYAHQVFDEMALRPTKLDFANHFGDWPGRVGSCDGLVLIESEGKLNLLNPTTQQLKQIPFFEDKSGLTMYGFGYDMVNHDYKIVTLTHYSLKRHSLCYSVKNGAWKNIGNCPNAGTLCLAPIGLFLDGYIHWLVSYEYQDMFKIISFDIPLEKFRQVLLPNSVTKDIKYGDSFSIVLLGGCLCVFCSSYTGEFCVWIMNEYGNNESWTKLTDVDPMGDLCSVICMLDQEQVLMKRYSAYASNLVKYNLNNRTFKDIVVDCMDSNTLCVRGTFFESLVSPYCSHETS